MGCPQPILTLNDFTMSNAEDRINVFQRQLKLSLKVPTQSSEEAIRRALRTDAGLCHPIDCDKSIDTGEGIEIAFCINSIQNQKP